MAQAVSVNSLNRTEANCNKILKNEKTKMKCETNSVLMDNVFWSCEEMDCVKSNIKRLVRLCAFEPSCFFWKSLHRITISGLQAYIIGESRCKVAVTPTDSVSDRWLSILTKISQCKCIEKTPHWNFRKNWDFKAKNGENRELNMLESEFGI